MRREGEEIVRREGGRGREIEGREVGGRDSEKGGRWGEIVRREGGGGREIVRREGDSEKGGR